MMFCHIQNENEKLFHLTGTDQLIHPSQMGEKPNSARDLKSFAAINFKLYVELSHMCSRMTIDSGVVALIFKVTEVTKVKFACGWYLKKFSEP